MTEISTAIAQLTWSSSDGVEEEFVIYAHSLIRIGRSRDCEINILNTLLSRIHSEIKADRNSCSLTDLNSKNGTFLNGIKLEESMPLKNGDVIKVGPVYFTFNHFATIESTPIPQEDEDVQYKETFVIPEPSVMPHLEVITGPQIGKIFELVKEKITVGRSGKGNSWDIVLHDRAVSRPQAKIVLKETRWILCDMNSANGTLVNDELIDSSCILKKGDVITFGETNLIFHPGVQDG
ncbi:MAG: FHA domain-containing protein [Anaerolineaceae bacterium]|nr:FHA domain-containing protein [Anaerolineaceae bacterium]